ncbi:adenosylmethionine decarboxylase [Candidatus Vampirococcus lugosii]|uniref:S-adenosylmethionine decarboxylase or arginine decarboxylase n=1 Tax=Candidatus Vampirococcus lugosii TaxID=2789015 RepID=A0ABS5QK20_9BACT|nr:S-adenosylmethionine decarboxylase or arginine decarboxylase [Candidatus Vampirococcus lugosii]
MKYRPDGKQFIADIWFEDNIPNIDNFVQKITNGVKLNIVDKYSYNFGIGETIIYILSESHFAIHTYPEYNYISIDIYTCGKSNPYDAEQIIKESFSVKKINIHKLQRGI